ncbi:MAG: glutathione S-transferase family protein [Pseudomonadota bacterium]
MQLINGLLSNNAAKVRMVLAEKGLAFESIDLPWTRTNAWDPKPEILLASNPRAQVPVLIDQDLTLWDSTVINEYLEDKHPQPSLFPTSAREKAICRLWEDEGDHNQTHVGVLIQEVFLAAPGSALSPSATNALSELDAFVDRLSHQIGNQDYICDKFSVADISVFLTLAFGQTLGLQVDKKNVATWYQRVLSRPPIKQEFDQLMAGVANLAT